MAPMCTARRLLLPLLPVFFVFLSLDTSQIESLLVYDRQTLLDLRQNVKDLSALNHGGQKTLPPLLSENPTHLLRAWALPSRRRRPRRRGKRSGQMVKLRICLARSSYDSRGVQGSLHPFTVPQRFLDPIDSCLVPVTGLDDVSLFRLRYPLPAWLRQFGINLYNLRAPLHVQRSAGPQAPAPTRIGLVNARSLANKTFILRELFNSRDLDFLCVTETWINAGECSPLVELLPADCSYFNSPQALGRGGGTATVFKGTFNCKQRPASFSSFELTVFKVGRSDPVLCAVIYRPPKYNKEFISDFSNFAGVMPNYDRVLLVGNFNLYVCCTDKPVVKDFLNIVDSFGLKQGVSGPTHEHG